MAFRTTFTKRHTRHSQAFTLIEILVAAGLMSLIVTLIATLMYFTSRSFVAGTNYANMSLLSRMALDKMSKTIRQAQLVTAYSTNSLTLLDVNGNTVRYAYDPSSQSLLCISGGTTNTYLKSCNTLQFWIYQRTPISNTFTCYNPASVTNAKLVQVTWSCSRQIFGSNVNNEVVESASICLRNH